MRIHSERELDLSFRLKPIYQQADCLELKSRVYPKSNSHSVYNVHAQMRERMELGKAFAKRIRQLILEIAYDLPHPYVKREEFYFSNDYLPIMSMTTEVGKVIYQYFRDDIKVAVCHRELYT